MKYDSEFEDEKDLIKIIDKINKKVNQSMNQSTGIQPIILLQKESEYDVYCKKCTQTLECIIL